MITVTRRDLDAGYQVVQSAHAIADFIFKFPFLSYLWHKRSNSIIALSVKDQPTLIKFIEKLRSKSIRHVVFREPDINNEITAIALEPTQEARNACKGLPLALKDFSHTGINKHNYQPIKNITI